MNVIADKVKTGMKEKIQSKFDKEADEKAQGFKKIEPLKNKVVKSVGVIGSEKTEKVNGNSKTKL